jgi:hypothetical protein
VEYTKTNPSPAISVKSLPELSKIVTTQPKKILDDKPQVEDEVDSVSRRTRSKKMFR